MVSALEACAVSTMIGLFEAAAAKQHAGLAAEVIMHDRLWSSMGELAEKFGRRLPDYIPNAKGQYRKDRRPAREILSNHQKVTIREAAKFEFEMFGFAV
jgi:hypothetical protein